MAETVQSEWTLACSLDSLNVSSHRIHITIEGRFVTVISHENHLYCIDSTCYHNGGPMASGDIENLSDHICISCPWHKYSVSLTNGSMVYKKLEMSNGKLVPCGYSTTANKQRTHEVEARDDNVFVRLNKDSTEYASDLYAYNAKCAENLSQGASFIKTPSGSVLIHSRK